MKQLLASLLAVTTATVFAADNWEEKLQRELPLLGHRNWIVVVDSAYPLQTAPGIETIYVEADQLEVVQGVMAELARTKHVKAVIYHLAPVVSLLEAKWPKNRAVNIVCHGHSVPAGYCKTPVVDSLHAYPHLLRVALAANHRLGLVESLAAFKVEMARGTPLTGLMSQGNHPNARGHELVAGELNKWCLARMETPSN